LDGVTSVAVLPEIHSGYLGALFAVPLVSGAVLSMLFLDSFAVRAVALVVVNLARFSRVFR
jgi:hypothetical protein